MIKNGYLFTLKKKDLKINPAVIITLISQNQTLNEHIHDISVKTFFITSRASQIDQRCKRKQGDEPKYFKKCNM